MCPRREMQMLNFEYSVQFANHILPFWIWGRGKWALWGWGLYAAEEKGILVGLNAQDMAWGISLNLSELLSVHL